MGTKFKFLVFWPLTTTVLTVLSLRRFVSYVEYGRATWAFLTAAAIGVLIYCTVQGAMVALRRDSDSASVPEAG